MNRLPLSIVVPDASLFAKSLGQSRKTRHAAGSPPPGHVELLNRVARALGHRNLQSLQAAALSPAAPLPAAPLPDATLPDATLPDAPLAPEDRPPPLALSVNARKALMQFDSRGRQQRWPTKFSVQKLAMWVLWTLFDGRRVYTEREVNEVLKAANGFDDHATLRRELVDHRLLSRKPDCSEYRKLAARPDDETRALLQAWRLRQRTRTGERVERDDSPRQRQQRLAAAAAAAAAPAA